MEAKRTSVDYRFKLLYAIGIILVIEGHMGGDGKIFFAEWFPIYSYHLALFMFTSGYFYNNGSENNLVKYVIRKTKSLLIPLYLWNIFYAVVSFVLYKVGFSIGDEASLYTIFIAPINDGHQFSFNMGGWYVVPLFMIQVYNVIFRKIVSFFFHKVDEFFFFFFNLGLGMFGIYIASIGLHEGWWLVVTRMLYFLPFYNLGILYKNKLEYWDKKIPDLWYFTVLLMIQLTIIFIHGEAPSYLPSWCNNFDDGVILPFIAGTLGIAFWFRIAVVLEPILGRSKIVNVLADNAYTIMINQFMGAMLVKTFYALIYRQTSFFPDFDMESYKSTIWYRYYPGGITQSFVFYSIAGIIFPIFFQWVLDWIKHKFVNLRKT